MTHRNEAWNHAVETNTVAQYIAQDNAWYNAMAKAAGITTIQAGNNESYVRGIDRQADGTYLALTATDSKEFKSRRGAENWLARRGYNPDGTRR
jgi:hypothetical protein